MPKQGVTGGQGDSIEEIKNLISLFQHSEKGLPTPLDKDKGKKELFKKKENGLISSLSTVLL